MNLFDTIACALYVIATALNIGAVAFILINHNR